MSNQRTEHPISAVDAAAFAKATAQGHRLLARGPLATVARYEAGRVRVELNNGCAFEFPVEHTQGLAGASPADLRTIQICAAGLGLHWPALDADLSVSALIRGILGTRQWRAQIGTLGGAKATKAEAVAARTHGKLGGRPRKRVQMASGGSNKG